jgi:hypothetical protein
VVPALLFAAPAHGQPGAGDDPRVTGPLYLVGSSCGDDRLTHEGETLAKVQSCIRLYEFDTIWETDATRTFGVAWLQSTVKPMNGWCATKVSNDVVLPETVSRHGRAPAKETSTKKPDRVRVKLIADADHNAIEVGTIAQSFDMYPVSLEPSLANRGQTIRTTWKGQESDELAFVTGTEVSWQVLQTPEIRGGLGKMSFVKSSDC